MSLLSSSRQSARSIFAAGCLVISLAPNVRAQAADACRPPVGPRMIAGCTAIVDDPAATSAERARALSYRAAAQTAMGNLDRALADALAAAVLAPDDAEVFGMLAKLHERKGQLDLALAAHDKAIALKPDRGLAYAARAMTREAMGQVDLAMTDYDEAIRRQPD